MDLYSNNMMLDWETSRRVAELRSMAGRTVPEASKETQEERHEPFTAFGRAWHDLFQHRNHGYKRV
jgi:hypothetical protein